MGRNKNIESDEENGVDYEEQYQRRLARTMILGTCVRCGKTKERKNQATCNQCSQFSSKRCKINNAGACTRCGISPPVPGLTGCLPCLNAERKRNAQIKAEALSAYGEVCECCGETNQAFLTLDHPNNDGGEHRRELFGETGTGNFYAKMRQLGFPPGLRVVCWNCNCGREINGGICPHQEELAKFGLSAKGALRVEKAKPVKLGKVQYPIVVNPAEAVVWPSYSQLVEWVQQSSSGIVAKKMKVASGLVDHLIRMGPDRYKPNLPKLQNK